MTGQMELIAAAVWQQQHSTDYAAAAALRRCLQRVHLINATLHISRLCTILHSQAENCVHVTLLLLKLLLLACWPSIAPAAAHLPPAAARLLPRPHT